MELIKINVNENQEPVISGRELHEKLGVETPFKKWMDRMLEYGFTESTDFTVMDKNVHDETVYGGLRKITEYILTLDTAKEICMLQRNEKGKEFRKYFIEIEKEFNSPEKIMARALKIADDKIKIQNIKIEKLEQKIEDDKARVSFAETIEKSSECILVREFAKVLANDDIHIGEKKIYQKLREWGYILLNSTEPTQRAVEQGLFKINERIFKSVKGDILSKTTLITGKGQMFLLEKFKKLSQVKN